MFECKETLLDKIKEMNQKKIVIKEEKEDSNGKYRDQLFIPYARKDSRIHSSAFGVFKDDYIVERREKFEFSRMKKRKIAKKINNKK